MVHVQSFPTAENKTNLFPRKDTAQFSPRRRLLTMITTNFKAQTTFGLFRVLVSFIGHVGIYSRGNQNEHPPHCTGAPRVQCTRTAPQETNQRPGNISLWTAAAPFPVT